MSPTSISVALTSYVYCVSSVPAVIGVVVNVGASFVLDTVTKNICVSSPPLPSETRTSTWLEPTWEFTGVHVIRPDEGLMVIPAGEIVRL